MENSDTYSVEVYSRLLGERLEPRRAVLRVMISRIQPWDLQSMHGDVVYNGRFPLPSRKLCHPDEARVAVSGMLAVVGIPLPAEDLDRIGREIAFKARMIASEARLLGRGPSIVAHIRIYHPEPLWVFEPEDDSDIPHSASMPWQHLQEAVAIDDVLVLDEGDLGSRRGFGGMPALSSAIKNLDRMSYDGEGRNWCREQACVICTEDFEQGAPLCRMPCCHVFHEGCLVRWLKQSRLCPLCRFSLR
ncbi:E3 ubiquitin-protein ligase RING1-like [Ananas comosus]|uniref:E3 ubiquitin-protein ligase RING1-like n=1 Tax=Ananas comosus TaxID=4615 RepID=A0A199VMH7_ANACO|nr:E3 ubiquitin-protein ligase RING1-like [Ananas comosus]